MPKIDNSNGSPIASDEKSVSKLPNHMQTKNSRGYMHPLSEISKQFVYFAKDNSPCMDLGCAYGNVIQAAFDSKVKTVIAYDMEQQHLDYVEQHIKKSAAQTLSLTKGKFPEEFPFEENSIGAIYASHVFEYLNEEEAESGLQKIFYALKPGGMVFILCYTIHILELANDTFKEEYEKRKNQSIKWPGYFKNINPYSKLPDDVTSDISEDALPSSIHLHDAPIFRHALERTGFVLKFCDYLDGKENGAVPETWNDGREYVGVIATKP